MPCKLFITYSHADMRPQPAYKESRAKVTLEQLLTELGADNEHGSYHVLQDVLNIALPSSNFRETIPQAISECDIAIAVLSKNYACSPECIDELADLLARSKRVFMLEMEDTWEKQSVKQRLGATDYDVPDNVGDIVRIEFFDDTKRYGYPLPLHASAESLERYAERMERAKHAIEVFSNEDLDVFGKTFDQQLSDLDDKTVLIPKPTPHSKDHASRLARALEREGFSICFFDPVAFGADSIDVAAATRKAAEKCLACVQVFDAQLGEMVRDGGAQKPRVVLQHQVLGQTDRPFFSWIDIESFTPEDHTGENRDFLSQAVKETAFFGPLEQFIPYILDELSELRREVRREADRQARIQKAEEQGHRSPLVRLDHAEVDQAAVDFLLDELRSLPVHAVPLDTELGRAGFCEAIQESDGVVMLYGESRESQNRFNGRVPDLVQMSKPINVAVGNDLRVRQPAIHKACYIPIDVANGKVDREALLEFITSLTPEVHQTSV